MEKLSGLIFDGGKNKGDFFQQYIILYIIGESANMKGTKFVKSQRLQNKPRCRYTFWTALAI